MDRHSHRYQCQNSLQEFCSLSFSVIAFVIISSVCSPLIWADQARQPNNQPLLDVTLPTWNSWAHRLRDWQGHAVVIITLPHCRDCEQSLIRYQIHLESLQHQGLMAFLLWPHTTPPPSSFRLPVLRYDHGITPSWLFHEENSVLYINTHGELERISPLNVRRDYDAWRIELRDWLAVQAPLVHQY